jgi:hypothetical protein
VFMACADTSRRAGLYETCFESNVPLANFEKREAKS